MKLLIFVMLALSLSAWGQGFTVTPTDPGLNESAVPEGQLVRPERARRKYLSPDRRDKVLRSLLAEETKGMDDLERDLLYKSIINYPNELLVKKYPFLKKKNIEEIRNGLH